MKNKLTKRFIQYILADDIPVCGFYVIFLLECSVEPHRVHLVKLLHRVIVHRILKNIPNFTKYCKMSYKIVLLNPPPNIPFQLRKPLVSPNIIGIHFYQPIFNIPFISYYKVVTSRTPNAS